MGLESINFVFRSDCNIEKKLQTIEHSLHLKDNLFAYADNGKYWIDLLVKDNNTLSLRIALCNPSAYVSNALIRLLKLLFEKTFILYSPDYNKNISSNIDWELEVKSFIKEKKDIFHERYGNIEQAISADSFYDHLNGIVENKL